MATETNTPGSRPARRTIVKGAAWAVPAVAVASAAPAHAASGDPIDPTFQPGTFCKHSSNNQAHGVICFANTTDEDITLTLGLFDWDSAGAQEAYFSIGGVFSKSATVGKNSTRCLWVDAGPFPSLGNDLARIYFSYPYQGATIETSVTTDTKEMSNCNSTPGQPGQSAPHPTPGPDEGNSALYEVEEQTEDEAQVDSEAPVEADAPDEVVETEAPVEADSPIETVEEPAVEAPAVEETGLVEEQTVDTAEVTSAPDVSTDESTENN